MLSIGAHTRTLNRNRFSVTHAINCSSDEQPDEQPDDFVTLAVQLRAAEAAQIRMVYAVLRRELPVVKIGSSKRLSGHGGRLRRMPGARLVALTPGDYADERELHQRFADSRVTAELPGLGATEHFRITHDLVEWINETRQPLNLRPVTLEQMLQLTTKVA